ncbi:MULTISPECIES: adhesin [unclassified Pseudomonas]|uniref:adhesin n=1 Tax=unclassified Pseudomonas TaxID=196821 RepID=UPI0011EBE996|nr:MULTISPECIES: adhesin [unclassified Pseudomonas]KAA0942541.1 adhesin [Pseudomonas sp. ANT_H4]KAA0948029.1 adhesin [Pseudomonas sp. ANT_H14]
MSRSWLLLLALGCSSVMADSNNNAVIDNSGKQYSGNLSVNQAAGNQQQQINSRAIAIGAHAQVGGALIQKLDGKADPSLNAKAVIQGSSFSNGSGVLGVNQSAGANNQMINAVRISISAGPQGIDDSVLSQQNMTLLPDSGLTSPTGSRQVVTSDQAFTGSRGVIQVNQSAGVGNRVANTLNVNIR